MAFEKICGNEPVKALLTHNLSSKSVGHAYIIAWSKVT